LWPLGAGVQVIQKGLLSGIDGDEKITIAKKENLDLVIGQDLITSYLGADDMDHPFRVFETVLLRIKRPEAICTFCVKTD